MKTLLKGGTVVSAAASRAADVLIEGEKILAVGENLPADGAAVVDVTGKLLFPGFIVALDLVPDGIRTSPSRSIVHNSFFTQKSVHSEKRGNCPRRNERLCSLPYKDSTIRPSCQCVFAGNCRLSVIFMPLYKR